MLLIRILHRVATTFDRLVSWRWRRRWRWYCGDTEWRLYAPGDTGDGWFARLPVLDHGARVGAEADAIERGMMSQGGSLDIVRTRDVRAS